MSKAGRGTKSEQRSDRTRVAPSRDEEVGRRRGSAEGFRVVDGGTAELGFCPQRRAQAREARPCLARRQKRQCHLGFDWVRDVDAAKAGIPFNE